MREKQKNIYLSGCTLHTVHNAAKKASKELPPVESVLIDIYYYFDKSTDRQNRFKGTQELYDVDQKRMHKMA